MGGKTIERTYSASPEDVYEAARHAVAELGYSVLHSDAAAKAISFNTGRSMKSWAGQDLTATVFASGDGSARVVVGGSLATRGNPLGGGSQLGAWGEKKQLSNVFLDAIARALLPGEGWLPDPSGRHPDRWWDGERWTEWVRDKPGGTRSEDPPGSLSPPTVPKTRPADARGDEGDPIEQLRRLGELRDAGVITSEQFDAKRDELLGRI
jgi:Short C-terminal domain/Protein of unknown function (DUF2510)